MEWFVHDLRYTFRGWRRSPGFTLVALVTLALGIGVNASIFGLVDAILFRPLPVERPGELVNIYSHPATENTHDTHSWPDYADFRAQARSVSGLFGYSNFFGHLSINGSSEIVVGEIVTDDYFRTLGVRPRPGRAFVPAEFAAQGAAPVAVISHRLWETHFGGDANVVGRTLRLDGLVYTVVGVAPASFGGMVPAVTAQMWIPASMVAHVEPLGDQWTSGPLVGASRLERRGQHWMWLTGRRNPGITAGQVQAEFSAIAARLGAQYPETDALSRVSVVPTGDVRLNPDIDRTILPAGLVLIGAVGLVLVVACANLANLMLARAAGRRREIAIRVAIGGTRGRLVRQLLTESVVLALAGGALALPLAAALAGVVARVQPPLPIDLGLTIGPDWRVVAFTFAAAAITGIVFGLVPALRASRPDLVPALKDTGNWTGRRRRVELRDALVVVQMAVSVVLVVLGTLMARSLTVAGKVALGYDGDHIASMAVALSMSGYDGQHGGQFLEAARQRLQAMPGVTSVALTTRAPLELNNNGFGLFIDGRQTSAADKPFAIDGAYVDESYAQTLGLRLIAGRWIEPADRDGSRRVAVVTQAMAERFWPGADAVGREFRLRWGGDPVRIVGVVGNYKVDTPGESPKAYIHLPFGRQETYADVLVRTATPAQGMVATLQRELRAMDPDLVFLSAGTLRGNADVRLFPVRAGAWLIGAFGALALVVAAVGLYGVIGYSVSRRVREIGIRKALGARPGMLVGMVLKEGMVLVGIGGVAGAVLAALGARALSGALYVAPFDVASFAAAFGVLAVVALAANLVPARRAARVEPMMALRQE